MEAGSVGAKPKGFAPLFFGNFWIHLNKCGVPPQMFNFRLTELEELLLEFDNVNAIDYIVDSMILFACNSPVYHFCNTNVDAAGRG